MILAIYGYGGIGRKVWGLAERINEFQQGKRWSEILFVDDKPCSTLINGCRTMTFEEFCDTFPPAEAEFVISVGEPVIRKFLADKIQAGGYSLGTLVHPQAEVFAKSIGAGTMISYGCYISDATEIGDNVYFQPNCTIGHDDIIGSHSLISSGVTTGGSVVVGEQSYIALNVCVRENVRIGALCIVGMGGVVLKDLPEKTISFGNPAVPVKKNERVRVFGSKPTDSPEQ